MPEIKGKREREDGVREMHFQTCSYQLLDFEGITRSGIGRINIIIIFYLLSFLVSRVYYYYIPPTTCHLCTAAVIIHYDCTQSS